MISNSSLQRSILITGCSSGIGWCAAHLLQKKGWKVFATVRRPEDKIRLKTQGLHSVLMDLDDPVSIQAGVESVLADTGGSLDALCNNAGFGQPGAIEDLTRDSLRAQFETNVFGLQELTNLIIPVMRAQKHGRIIYISSMLGQVTMAYRGAYCASKYAVEALADALRLELHSTGIFISLIEPGPIQSQFRVNAHKMYHKISTDMSAHQENYMRLIQHNVLEQKEKPLFTLPPEAVVKKLMHALYSTHPKARYYITLPSYFFMILKRMLPTRCLDRIFLYIMRKETKKFS